MEADIAHERSACTHKFYACDVPNRAAKKLTLCVVATRCDGLKMRTLGAGVFDCLAHLELDRDKKWTVKVSVRWRVYDSMFGGISNDVRGTVRVMRGGL